METGKKDPNEICKKNARKTKRFLKINKRKNKRFLKINKRFLKRNERKNKGAGRWKLTVE